MSKEIDEAVPGYPQPSKKLFRETKATLRHWGVAPGKGLTRTVWRLAWAWAQQVARSYDPYHLLKESQRRRFRWPSPTEIATQYLVLLVADLQKDRMLRLPYRAGEQMPEPVRQHLAAAPALAALASQPKALPLKEEPGDADRTLF